MITSSNFPTKRKISLWLMIAVYLAAGINHFRVPEFYYPIIPDYMGQKPLLNTLSGIAELAGAIGLMIPATRKWAAYGIVAMLIAFLPTHIYMITDADKIALAGMPLPVWAAWVRLVIIQPILIWWAWSHRNS